MNYEIEKNISISRGNSKLGKIKNFNLPSGMSCPGKSEWCKNCYAKRYEKRFRRCQTAYIRNLEYSEEPYFSELIVDKLKKKYGFNVRIHPSGDFYSVDYIDKWINICMKMSNHNFWCYTRSWIVPELFEKIKKLSKLKNIQVLLSTDPTMDMPPKDFRIAFVEEDKRSNGMTCLHDLKLKETCLECGYCFKNKKGNVIFKNKLKRRNKS